MAGRPKKEINYKQVETLASIFCTQEEIASVLNISVRTLQRDEEFCRIYKKGQDKAKSSLRRMQYKLADRNPTMAIWLGKQYLGQRESFPDEVNYTEINKGIQNIANLINNPVKERKEDEIEEGNE